MICSDCCNAADWQKAGRDEELHPHPEKCGCFCQHRPVKAGQIVDQ